MIRPHEADGFFYNHVCKREKERYFHQETVREQLCSGKVPHALPLLLLLLKLMLLLLHLCVAPGFQQLSTRLPVDMAIRPALLVAPSPNSKKLP